MITLALFMLSGEVSAGGFLLFSTETGNKLPIYGRITTPGGELIDVREDFRLIDGVITDVGATVVFDLATRRFDVYVNVSPYQLIVTNDDFAQFDPRYDLATYTAASRLFTAGVGEQQVNAPGAVTYVGDFQYPAYLNIGGSTDGDAFPDEFDNCPGISTSDQADFDEDTLGDVCDSDDDGDGLLDIDEMTIYGTNPLDADSDNDGFTDGDEVDAETDPLNDSDFPTMTIETEQIPTLPTLALVLLACVLLGLHRGNRSRLGNA